MSNLLKDISEGIVSTITSLWNAVYPPDPFHSTTERNVGWTEATEWAEQIKFIQLKDARKRRYEDYDEMDEEMDEISSALDIYSDFVTTGGSEKDEVYTVEMQNKDKKALEIIQALEERLALKERAWWISRETAKYGDAFYELVATTSNIVKIVKLPVKTMFYNISERTKRVDVKWPLVQKDPTTQEVLAKFAPWEIVHFRMGEDMYGVKNSILGKMRRSYRALRMLEDSMLINRLTRAYQRLVYKVDVSNMGATEAITYITKLKKLNRRRRLISSTGKLKTEENPLAPQEDIYLPVRKGSLGGLDVIKADSSVASIADVKHMHSKLFTATKVPKAYLGFEGEIKSKSTLVQQTLAFTKAVRRVRRAVAEGLKKIYKVELVLSGINPTDLGLKIRFPSFGVADEELRWRIELYKAQIVNTYAQASILLPTEWVIRNLMFGLSPSEADEVIAMLNKGEPTSAPVKKGGVTPGVPTATPSKGAGRKKEPLGPESVVLSDLREKVLRNERLRKIAEDLSYMLKHKETPPDIY